MMPRLLIAALALCSVAARSQRADFHSLSMQADKDTTFGNYTLHLGEPDNPAHPTLWQGPLTIASGTASCTADVSLVGAVYAAAGRSFVIVVSSSGSSAVVNFIDLASCSAKWPAIKRAAGEVTVAGNRVSFLPACEGGASNAPALCSSARVYAIRNDSPPAWLRSVSYKLTAKELGVGFTGEAKVMDPHTPRAIVVH